jgi:hypothetical protein
MDSTDSTDMQSGQMGGRTAWMAHVKKTMRANKGKSLKQVLKMAAKSYKKSGKKTARKTRKGKGKRFLGMFGGAAAETAAPTEAAETATPMMGGRHSRKSKKGGSKYY